MEGVLEGREEVHEHVGSVMLSSMAVGVVKEALLDCQKDVCTTMATIVAQAALFECNPHD